MLEMNSKKKEENLIFNKRIAKNLRNLMEQHDVSQKNLSEELRKIGGGYTLDRTTINKILNSPDANNISLPFLAACAQYFQTTVDFLISEHTSAESCETTYEPMPLAVPALSENGGKKSELFVENPNSVFFKNYLNTYYCYYYSTVSEENKGDNPILTGELTLFPRNNKCKCILKVDTRKVDSEGEAFFKIYTGETSICLATQTVHCVMREENIGEYCDLMFRYSQLNSAKQACRMAEVLSTSSLPDKRYPIVHRMLLSISPIDIEHLDLIKPQLCLNCSEIIISETDLDFISEQSKECEALVSDLKSSDSKKMFILKEKNVKEAAEKYFPEEGDLLANRLRNYSHASRYNKVSTRVDINIWNILHNAGYYQQRRTK